MPYSATERASRRGSGSANETAITAIISLRTLGKPTKKQAVPFIMHREVANSSHSSFILAVFRLESEKQTENQILNQKLHTTRQILNKNVSFCQILK